MEHRALVKGHRKTRRPDGTIFLELVLILVASILILVLLTGSLVLFTPSTVARSSLLEGRVTLETKSSDLKQY